MKTKIKNFTGAAEVEIKAHRNGHGDTVMIHQDAGAMHFQFDMKAADARLMAAALMASADEIEVAQA